MGLGFGEDVAEVRRLYFSSLLRLLPCGRRQVDDVAFASAVVKTPSLLLCPLFLSSILSSGWSGRLSGRRPPAVSV